MAKKASSAVSFKGDSRKKILLLGRKKEKVLFPIPDCRGFKQDLTWHLEIVDQAFKHWQLPLKVPINIHLLVYVLPKVYGCCPSLKSLSNPIQGRFGPDLSALKDPHW